MLGMHRASREALLVIGRQSDFTLGLNWYPDKGIRFMANWVQYSAPYNLRDINGIHPQLFALRPQVNWYVTARRETCLVDPPSTSRGSGPK
jgi:phosphate-selective porin